MFLENKYTKWYFNIINNAQSKNRKKKEGIYYESHHIIPKCMEGKEEVLLTAKEHFISHLLLCKMTFGKNRHNMINALIKMAFSKSKGQERYTSKSYSLIRTFIGQKNSENFKGKKKTPEQIERMKEGRKNYVFTKKHIENLKISIKNRNHYGANNGFFGMKHSKESMEKRRKTRKIRNIKPIFTGKGMKWITNGIIDKFSYINEIPEGYYLGRSKRWSKKNVA